MANPAFDPKELEIIGEQPAFGGRKIPIFKTPVSLREGALAFYSGKPVWQILGTSLEGQMFCPAVNPDNIARALVIDGTTRKGAIYRTGGKDMFGIDWEFVPEAGGSMVRPGNPFISDASELAEKVVWPDLNSWDWDQAVKDNKEFLNSGKFNHCWLMNGWYERLISFMDFEGAIVALIDEEQQDYVKDFFDKLSDFYIELLGRFLHYFPEIDGFYIHDDWGAQKDCFFSPETCEEMIVPYMRKVTDWIHSQGKLAELHSCGQIFRQIPNIIKAGWDAWSPQVPKNVDEMYELYADKLIIGFGPEPFDPETASEEEQRQAARDFVKKYIGKDKPRIQLGGSAMRCMTPAFAEELYKQSRIAFAD